MNACIHVGIGETLQHEVERETEENKQKAIRCTEEVVRREEGQRRENELTKAKEEWRREKQQIYVEAHHSQLRAIAKETDILERALRKEFEEDLTRVRAECKHQLEIILQETWREADRLKEQAVTDAHHEEQYLAQQVAKRVAEEVYEEKKKEKEEAEKDKSKALTDLTEYMNDTFQNSLVKKQNEMEEKFAVRINEIQQRHVSQISNLEEQLGDEQANNSGLRVQLQETTDSRDSWKEKYKDLKTEFSDFIDQCPGFRGEFLLK